MARIKRIITKVNKQDRWLEESPKKANTKKQNSQQSQTEEEEKQRDYLCKCRKPPTVEEEWLIICDICTQWYHGKCHGVNEKQARHIDRYRCINCIVIPSSDSGEDGGDEQAAGDVIDDNLRTERTLRAKIKEMEEMMNKKEMVINGLETEVSSLKLEASHLRKEREIAVDSLEQGRERSKIAFQNKENEMQQLMSENKELHDKIRHLNREIAERNSAAVDQVNNTILIQDDEMLQEIEIEPLSSQQDNIVEQLLQAANKESSDDPNEATSTKTDTSKSPKDGNKGDKTNSQNKKKTDDENALMKENKKMKTRIKKLEEEWNDKVDEIATLNKDLDYYFMEVKLLRETKSALKKANTLLEKKVEETPTKKTKSPNQSNQNMVTKAKKQMPQCRHFKRDSAEKAINADLHMVPRAMDLTTWPPPKRKMVREMTRTEAITIKQIRKSAGFSKLENVDTMN